MPNPLLRFPSHELPSKSRPNRLRKSRRIARQRQVFFESLESRCVLAADVSLAAVLDGFGNLSVTDTAEDGRDNQLTVVRNGTNLEITDAVEQFFSAPVGGTLSNSNRTLSLPLVAVSGNFTFSAGAGDDTLTVDLTGGDAIPLGNITFHGGDPTIGPGDTLVIAGGDQGVVTYNHLNAHDGNIVLANFGTITYTGLEPILNSGTATDIVFNLPAATNAVTFEDDGIAGNGMSRLSGGTFETTVFSNPTGSLTINPGSVGDTITSNALPDFNASLTLGTTSNRFQSLRWDGAVTLGANQSLVGFASGSILFPTATSDFATSGSGGISLTTARNILVGSGASLQTTDGQIELNANLQMPATAENFRGIEINGSARTTGLGNVTITGRGGAMAGPSAYGVMVSGASAQVSSGGGTVLVTGTGGGAGSSNFNYGTYVEAATITNTGMSATATVTVRGFGGGTTGVANDGVYVNAGEITSNGGPVVVEGTGGGGTGSAANNGISVQVGGRITSAGTGSAATVTVRGFGAPAASGGNNRGVQLGNSGVITSSGGAVLVEGTGGGASGGATSAGFNEGINVQGGGIITSDGMGSVTVRGFGGNTPGSNNKGVSVYASSQITSSGGPVVVEGTAGAVYSSSGTFNEGVAVSGVITSAGTSALALVTVTGQGGYVNGGSFNSGIVVSGSGALITSSGGAVTVNGNGGFNSYAVIVNSDGQIRGTAGTAALTVIGNSMDLSSPVSINAGLNQANVRPRDSQRLDIGAADVFIGAGATLGLTDTELDRITASIVNLGNSNTNLISLVAPVTPNYHLTITSSAGFTATHPLTMPADKNLIISTLSTTNGSITLTAAAADLTTAGSGSILLSARRNIVLSAGSSFTTVDGNLTVDANQQVTPTTGNFVGIDLNGGLLQSTGAGAVTVRGKGGTDSTGNQHGTVLQAGGSILSASGALTVLGNGGLSTWGGNYGIFVIGTGSLIRSTGGPILVEGRGGGTGAVGNQYGLRMESQGRIANDGVDPAAGVTVRGFGGGTTGTGQFSSGVSLEASQITASGGPLLVEGTGAANPGTGHSGAFIRSSSAITNSGTSAAATVTLRGFGGNASLQNASGILLDPFCQVSSAGGAVLLEGTGGSNPSAPQMLGIYLAGIVTSTSPTAPITINGTAGGGVATGTGSHGVNILGSMARVTSGGGPVTINAVGPSVTTNGYALKMDSSSQIVGFAGSTVTINADSMEMTTSAAITGNAAVTIQPRTAGTRIDLGGADVLSGSPLTLGLTDTELDLISASVLQVGSSTTGQVTVSAAITHVNHLAITTGAGVTVTQSITMAANKNLAVTALGTSAGITLGTNTGDLVASGTGSITVTTARNVSLATGSTIMTHDGALTIDANQQATPTSGNFVGVSVSNTSLGSTGAGAVVVRGKGGTDSTGGQYGINLGAGAFLIGGSGPLTVVGTGGATSGHTNHGVRVSGTSAQITSTGGGTVLVEGTGGGSGASISNRGVQVEGGGEITNLSSAASATLTVRGFGGNATGTGGGNTGIQLFTGHIRSSGGPVLVEGTGPDSAGGGGGINVQPDSSITSTGTSASATVTVRGFGGDSAAGQQTGVDLLANSLISSAGGAVLVEGFGGSHVLGPFMVGLSASGTVTSTSPTAPVTITGTGGTLGNGGNNIGVWLNGSLTRITSGGGPVTVNAIPGNVAAGSKSLLMQNTSQIVGAASGTTVTVNADSIDMASNALMNGGGALLIIQPRTAGTRIDLGGADVLAGTPLTLGLSDNELDRITASNLRIGSATAGQMTVSADVTRPAAGNVELVSGADIVLSGGQWNNAGGSLLLDPGVSPAAVRATKSGLDATTGTLATAGDLAFVLNGATVDTQHTQLNVVGQVNLTGVGLALSGSFNPVNLQSFVLINNDLADPVVGTFNGSPEGAILMNPLGNGKNAVITYVGGDGNDVVLHLGNQLPTINAISNVTINEDALLQTVNLAGITAGTGESQALTITATSSNPTLIPNPVANYTSPNATGTLSFTPNANENGTAVITVTVRDAGADGIAGNADDSLRQTTFTVSVTAVNDAPSFVRGADQTVAFNPGPQSVAGWATAIAVGPANESAQSLVFSVTNNSNPALFSSPPAIASNGTLTFAPTATAIGTATIMFVAQDNGATANGGVDTSSPQTFTITINPPSTLRVLNAIPTASGVVIDFSHVLETSTLNLYDSEGSPLGPADVTLAGATVGNVRGSGVVDPNLRRFTFVRTAGVLLPDTYTLTVRSTANGFQSTSVGTLDGDGNGAAGDHYTQTFVVDPPPGTAVTVSVPNLARGPQQPVNLPANGTAGIPVTLSNGDGVTSASFQLRYNPALLDITSAAVSSGMPAGSSVSFTFPSSGVMTVQFTSPSPLPIGVARIVDLLATTPTSATYLSKHVLDLTNVSLNAGVIPAIEDDGVHVVAYFGDSTASGTYTAQDAARISRVAIGLDAGFQVYKLLDPVIIADINGSGNITSADSSRALQLAVGTVVPDVPAQPTPAVSLVYGGPDPKLSVATDLRAAPGESLAIPVQIDSIVDLTGNGLESADLVLYYDARVLDVDSVSLGSLFTDRGLNWMVTSRIDALAGRIIVSLAGTRPLAGRFIGELVQLQARVKADAPAGASAINLAASSRDPSRFTQLNEGYLTLIPAPTDAANDPVDGLVTILPDPSTSGQLASVRYMNDRLRVTGTANDDHFIIGHTSPDRIRVRVDQAILGDFAKPAGFDIEGQGGIDLVTLAAGLSSGDAEIITAASARTNATMLLASSPHPRLDGEIQPPSPVANAEQLAQANHSQHDLALLRLIESWSREGNGLQQDAADSIPNRRRLGMRF